MIKPILSLDAWSSPKTKTLRRIIALGMAVSFLFPAMSWAFQVQSVADESNLAPSLIPSYMGSVVETSKGTNGTTLYLIQDLHCNYEVQTNIRRILNTLSKKNPGLNLVAVEGASGIVPTRKLALLPDTPAKRAVANYFMREGKLTGADVFAVCDAPRLELFGAESSKLYTDSLALIRDYATEANRGLIFDLSDRIKFLQARQNNPALQAFEKRREAVNAGRMDVRDYHLALMRDALRLGVALDMQTYQKAGGLAWDMYQRTLMDRVLEAQLRERLFKTDAERQLSAYRQYVEMAEHILSVSASQADIDAFKTRSAQMSLASIYKKLQSTFAKMDYYGAADPAFGEELAGLEKTLQKGLQFYQLAQDRNRALFERSLARARARGEQKVALVAGGFHTAAISELARAQGYAVVTIRPRQNKPDASSTYFLRLRYPDRPTKLETLVAQYQATVRAIAAPNQVGAVTPTFGNAVTALITGAKNSSFYKAMVNELRGIAPETKATDFLSKPVVRITGLVILGLVIATAIPQILAGVTVAPVLIAAAVALLIVGAWASFAPENFRQTVPGKMAVLSLAIVVAGMAFTQLGLPMLADFVTMMASGSMPTFGHLHGTTTMLHGMSTLAPEALRTFPHETLNFGSLTNTMGTAVASMTGIPWLGKDEAEGFAPVDFEDLHQMGPGNLLGNIQARILIKRYKNIIGDGGTQPGAVQIFPAPKQSTAIYYLSLLGINKFTAGWSLSTKTITIMKGKELLLQQTPMLSFPILGEPEAYDDNRARLFHGIHIIQPRFEDENGNVIDVQGVLPIQYIRGVVNVFLPHKFYIAAAPLIKEVLGRVKPELRQTLITELQTNIGEWEKNPPLDVNQVYTQEVFDELMFIGTLHEYWHGLGLHMPDKFPELITLEDKIRLSQYSVDAWKTILGNHPEFKKSMVGMKNLIKALLDAFHLSKRADINEFIENQQLLENQADRSSMYIFEEGLKIGAIKNSLGLEKDATSVVRTDPDGSLKPVELIDFVYDIENALREGKLQDMMTTRYPALFINKDENSRLGALQKITEEFQKAEGEHPYIKHFKVPKIYADEREYFRKAFDHLRYFDRKNMLTSFDENHYFTSRFIINSELDMGARAIGFLQRVANYVSPLVFEVVKLGSRILSLKSDVTVSVKDTVPEVITSVEEKTNAVAVMQRSQEQPAEVTQVIQSNGEEVSAGGLLAELSNLPANAEATTPQSEVISLQTLRQEEKRVAATTQNLGNQEALAGSGQTALDLLSDLSNLGAEVQTPAQTIETAKKSESETKANANPVVAHLGAGVSVVNENFEIAETTSALDQLAELDQLNNASEPVENNTAELRDVKRGAQVQRIGMDSLQGVVVASPSASQGEVKNAAPTALPTTPGQVEAANLSLAPSRIGAILPGLFDAWNNSPAPPPQRVLQVYLNDPFLALALEGVLGKLSQINQVNWGGFGQAGSVQIRLVNPSLGTQSTPAPGQAGSVASQMSRGITEGLPAPGSFDGMVILTPQAGNPAASAMVYANGKVGIPASMVAIPRTQLPAGAVTQEMASADMKRFLTNGEAYGDMLLLTQAQAQALGLQQFAEQPGFAVQALVDSQHADLIATLLGLQKAQWQAQWQALQRMITLQTDQLKAAFARGVKTAPVVTDGVTAEQVRAAAAGLLAHGDLMMFGSAASGTSASTFSLKELSAIAQKMGLSMRYLGATDSLAENVVSEAGEGLLDVRADFERIGLGVLDKTADKSSLKELAGKDLTAQQYENIREDLKEGDQVAVLSKGRSHGVDWRTTQADLGPEMMFVTFDRAQDAKQQFLRQKKNMQPLEKTPFLTSTGTAKTVSVLALLIAASKLVVWDTLLGLNRSTGKYKAQPVNLFGVLFHPAFGRILWLMAKIVFGQYGDRDIVDPLLRQQLRDLNALEAALKANGKTLASLVGTAEVPTSLKFSLRFLVALQKFVGNVLGWLEKTLNWAKVKNINLSSLDPEMLLLVNEFLELNSVTWYFSRQTYMLRQIELHKDALDKTLYGFLLMTPDELKRELGSRHEQANRLKDKMTTAALSQAETQLNYRLQTEIRDLQFVRFFHKTLLQMDKPDSSPRLVKTLLRKLESQLTRPDFARGGQKITAEELSYKNSILKIISFVDPDNQTTVQIMIPEAEGTSTLFFNIPNVLKTSPELLELFLNNYPMYDKDNNPIEVPIRNRIVRAVQAA